MKSKLLLFLLLCWSVSSTLYAQQSNGVMVSDFTIETDHSVTFKLMWDRDAMPPAVWSDTVWVFADYNNAGTMTRIPLSTAGATLIETSAPGIATVIPVSGNNQGVYVVGNARTTGVFSATVKLVPDGITFSAGQTGCAYASNYPPIAVIDEERKVTFMGTFLTFKGTISNGVTDQQVFFDSEPYFLPEGYWIKDFTDTTSSPGIFSSGDPGCAVANLLITGDGVYCADDNILVGLAAAHAGWTYTLKNGATSVGTPVTDGTGAPQTFTFSGSVGSGTYTVAATKGTCEIISNNSVKILVNVPDTPIIVATDVCQGSDLMFGISSPVPGGTYTWNGLAGMTSGLGNATYTASDATAGVKNITVNVQTNVNGTVCTSADASGNATVYNLPVITGQPVSYLLVDLNNPFSLSVTAQPGSGTTLGYQWKRNGSNVTNGNAATYNAAGTVNAGGAYHVVVSNAYACNVTSGNATIDVQDLPPIAECRGFEAGKIGSSATGSCTGFDAGAVGISLACYQFDAGNIGK